MPFILVRNVKLKTTTLLYLTDRFYSSFLTQLYHFKFSRHFEFLYAVNLYIIQLTFYMISPYVYRRLWFTFPTAMHLSFSVNIKIARWQAIPDPSRPIIYTLYIYFPFKKCQCLNHDHSLFMTKMIVLKKISMSLCTAKTDKILVHNAYWKKYISDAMPIFYICMKFWKYFTTLTTCTRKCDGDLDSLGSSFLYGKNTYFLIPVSLNTGKGLVHYRVTPF